MSGRRQKTPKTKKQALAEELARGVKTPEDLSAFCAEITKLTVEAALRGEITHHLGYESHDTKGLQSGNSRNVYLY